MCLHIIGKHWGSFSSHCMEQGMKLWWGCESSHAFAACLLFSSMAIRHQFKKLNEYFSKNWDSSTTRNLDTEGSRAANATDTDPGNHIDHALFMVWTLFAQFKLQQTFHPVTPRWKIIQGWVSRSVSSKFCKPSCTTQIPPTSLKQAMVRQYHNPLRNNIIQCFYLPSRLSADMPLTPGSHQELESKGHPASNLAWSPVLAQERRGVPQWNSNQGTHNCHQCCHQAWKHTFLATGRCYFSWQVS